MGKQVDSCLIRISPGRGGQGGEPLLGGEVHGGDGVVLEVFANGQIDPLLLGRQLNAGVARSDNLELRGRADARVEEDAGGRVRAGGENDRSPLVDLDDVARAVCPLNLDTSGEAALADDAQNLDVEQEGEVVEGLGLGEDGPGRAVAETVDNL